jgi:hypothetical protein
MIPMLAGYKHGVLIWQSLSLTALFTARAEVSAIEIQLQSLECLILGKIG